MIMEDFGRTIDEFEKLLQKIATDITSGVIFERLPPSEIWSRSESSVTLLQNIAKQLMEIMLLLKPEKTPITKKKFKAVVDPLNSYKETLFQRSEDPVSNARLALEQLRKSVMEGSEFLKLAKDIESNPSEVITEILKLREVFGSKEYISAMLIPEVIHARFMALKKHFENLRLHLSSLEKALEDIRTQMDIVEEEIKKFRPSPRKTEEDLEKKEPREEDKPTEPQLKRQD